MVAHIITTTSCNSVNICSCRPVVQMKTFEVEVTIINAENERHTRHLEFDSTMGTLEGVANELLYELIKAVGIGRIHLITDEG
jgi:hypothetical protein